MNTLCTKVISFVFLFVSVGVNAQNDTEVFSENAFALRRNFNNTYSTNFELSTRAFIYTNNELLYKTRQIQIAHFSTLKLNLKSSVALGLMYRNRGAFEDSSNEIRLTQQFNKKSIFKTLRFGHRFRSEQRFYDSFTAFRFRYRLALDVPLQGLKLDVGETYFIVSNEGLFTSAHSFKPEIEYRLSPSIGMLLSDDLNIELGLELRLDRLNITTEETLFFNTSIELKI
ncbi:DUF2490 domain-containing protein [uncultured Psychroserpens sp.]|uniref:DUF2490 domain-containing protein n=1 Tax=uncultured Psychroserpens sp. TaxID=255436 RepID=UPI0026374848|nr:DUF2490 domain-containing protein [uncultured Psychroserpens sp.]